MATEEDVIRVRNELWAKRNKVSSLLPKRLGLGEVSGDPRGKTRFAAAYKSGYLGRWIRVDQNGSSPDIKIDFELPLSILPLCFEGLRETTHPLCLLARRGAARILTEHPRRHEISGLLPQLVPLLRTALTDVSVVEYVVLLAQVTKGDLLPYLPKLLPPLARLKVRKALYEIESHVPNSRPIIKAKIPSF